MWMQGRCLFTRGGQTLLLAGLVSHQRQHTGGKKCLTEKTNQQSQVKHQPNWWPEWLNALLLWERAQLWEPPAPTLTKMIYATGNARAIWLSFQNNHRLQWNQGVQEQLFYQPRDPSWVCFPSFNLMILCVCFAAQVSVSKPARGIYGDWQRGFSLTQHGQMQIQTQCSFTATGVTGDIKCSWNVSIQGNVKLWEGGASILFWSKQWKGSESAHYNLRDLWLEEVSIRRKLHSRFYKDGYSLGHVLGLFFTFWANTFTFLSVGTVTLNTLKWQLWNLFSQATPPKPHHGYMIHLAEDML